MSERWDIETITARAARDWADQFHFGRGAGDDSEAYEADYAHAKRGIAEALAEHDRRVAERAWNDGHRRGIRWKRGANNPTNPYRAAKGEQKLLDPKPWLFISDQVFGEFRSDHDEGYNSVSGTYWAFSPRPTYSQDREDYAS